MMILSTVIKLLDAHVNPVVCNQIMLMIFHVLNQSH
jgi:hypothetical protein